VGCKTNQSSIPFGCLCYLLVCGPLFVFLGAIIAEEVDSVGGRGSGDATMVDVPKLMETFLNMS